MFGWLFSSPKPEPSRRKKIDEGLWYRTCGDYEVIVEATKKFLDGYDDGSPISADSVSDFKRCNVTPRGCTNESEAIAIRTVMWNMDWFCPGCNEEMLHEDDKCWNCNARLWRTPLTFTLVRVAK